MHKPSLVYNLGMSVNDNCLLSVLCRFLKRYNVFYI